MTKHMFASLDVYMLAACIITSPSFALTGPTRSPWPTWRKGMFPGRDPDSEVLHGSV